MLQFERQHQAQPLSWRIAEHGTRTTLLLAFMANSFSSSSAMTAGTVDQVARKPIPTVPERSEARVKAEPTELPASPVATTKSNESTELPASPMTTSNSKIGDITEAAEAKERPAILTEKKNWIPEESHNGSLEDFKHDPRAGSGIEFVSPMEEKEKQLHQASPQNEESSPKYPIPKRESEGLEALSGQNQGNTAVYINNDEEEEVGHVDGRPEDDWHFTLCSCWSQGGLCMYPNSVLPRTIDSQSNRRRVTMLSLRPSRSNTPTSPESTYFKQPLHPHSFD